MFIYSRFSSATSLTYKLSAQSADLQALFSKKKNPSHGSNHSRHHPCNSANLTRWGRALLELAQFHNEDSKNTFQEAITKLEEALLIEPKKHVAIWCLRDFACNHTFGECHSEIRHRSPLANGGIYQNARADLSGWPSQFPLERSVPSYPPTGPKWLNSLGSPSGLIAKGTIRVDIPVNDYPNYNFVGRLRGPRGNSLKRVEASIDCRVLIRGRGSIKDPVKEMMRGKPGFEHFNEPLHILVEAELPIEIVDARLMQAREILDELLTPMEETNDFYKKQQLRELAFLNGNLLEEVSPMSGSVSPYNSLSL